MLFFFFFFFFFFCGFFVFFFLFSLIKIKLIISYNSLAASEWVICSTRLILCRKRKSVFLISET